MLEAGGVQTVARYPAYEDDAILRDQLRASDIQQRYAGRAVKWLNPIMRRETAATWGKVIYLIRDPIEQARSALKLIGQGQDRRTVRALAADLRQDDHRAVKALKAVGPIIILQFETMIGDPLGAAHRLGEFAGAFTPNGFDALAAGRMVKARGVKSQPDLAIEISQILQAKP